MNQEINLVKTFLLTLQDKICQVLAHEEATQFKEEYWDHDEGGGGRTRILQGKVIEKAGVNFSHVRGKQLPSAATKKRPSLINASFEALGVSVVSHPLNPYVPTAHFNIRLIVVKKENQSINWWVGGGFDLTPYYGFSEDCVHWHKMAKAACEILSEDAYCHYKKWADDYFYLPHRQEARGIGGIFFDDLNEPSFEKCFDFLKGVGEHFILAYQPILARRKLTPYTERERQFQLYRRGRYVEFNLLYDRGTLFGLQSQGRTESILMSLPPLVAWEYNWQPADNTAEKMLYDDFLQVRAWVD